MDGNWIIFRLKDQQFAIAADYVREMVSVSNMTHIPQMPEYVRGVMKLRSDTIPLFDLRILLGMDSAAAETEKLIATLHQREQDHLNWIKELETSIQENREFKLTTDPTKCAFGKWYYSFKTDNLLLKSHLQQFDQPHRDIHQLGIIARKLAAEKKKDEALELITRNKNTKLKYLLQLFSELYVQLASNSREIALIVHIEDKEVALAVDSVVSVETLLANSTEKLQNLFGSSIESLVPDIGKRKNDLGLVMLMDAKMLFSDTLWPKQALPKAQ